MTVSRLQTVKDHLAGWQTQLPGIAKIRAAYVRDPIGQTGLVLFLCAAPALWEKITQAKPFTYPYDVVQNIGTVAALLDSLLKGEDAAAMVLSEPLIVGCFDPEDLEVRGVTTHNNTFTVPRVIGDSVWLHALMDGRLYEWYQPTMVDVEFIRIVIVPDVEPHALTDEDALRALTISSGWNPVMADDKNITEQLTAQLCICMVQSVLLPQELCVVTITI